MTSRQELTRQHWLETIERYRFDPDRPASADLWSPRLDGASRDELTVIQNAKLAALTPFLYENSDFYRRRFDRLGLAPTDIRTTDDLAKWPVVDKAEMAEDALLHPPYGTYSTMTPEVWAMRGWMMFSSSGTTGTPRVFRYSQLDRELWSWANARALLAMDFRHGDTVFMITGYGPHVWAWGVQVALAKLGLPLIPGGGMDGKARAGIVQRFQPTILLCTPSYALYLGRVLQELGHDPRGTKVRLLFLGGEPAMGIDRTRERIQDLWGARIVEFYGCTEAAPHVGGYSCAASDTPGQPVFAHLMEDVQIWETVDPETRASQSPGQRGLTVCTNLNSESSPQLRFLVGDYATFDRTPCACGRSHVRAIGCFTGRADDLLNLRGIKMFPAQIEAAVRSLGDVGDEYEVLLTTNPDGLDVMTIRIEHLAFAAPSPVAQRLTEAVRTHLEVRVDVEVLRPGTLPKTEFKAKRIRDQRAHGR
jgi:phenylacetate-CoA ligase